MQVRGFVLLLVGLLLACWLCFGEIFIYSFGCDAEHMNIILSK